MRSKEKWRSGRLPERQMMFISSESRTGIHLCATDLSHALALADLASDAVRGTSAPPPKYTR